MMHQCDIRNVLTFQWWRNSSGRYPASENLYNQPQSISQVSPGLCVDYPEALNNIWLNDTSPHTDCDTHTDLTTNCLGMQTHTAQVIFTDTSHL